MIDDVEREVREGAHFLLCWDGSSSVTPRSRLRRKKAPSYRAVPCCCVPSPEARRRVSPAETSWTVFGCSQVQPTWCYRFLVSAPGSRLANPDLE
ncbi:uncharacterized protein THITE_2123719 [Thermothielavioides terrestris NRRL 8126]|jgi:hypothetical protein|uniref:Uncharacterized protein n=1 Tax=Thermothielavioides terrestris (strain ATCC 38088 / NRRL 8126) TaxID=578455 RepID=G2RHU0_THETT|nr:uncharacterized protein THITE_2123719 [Thermothielavioides terrestris NRRL 8126]AEO71402.1 hypothetical protein THITE_2123719 [Thermothielavioides terrestris NRRL 8126]